MWEFLNKPQVVFALLSLHKAELRMLTARLHQIRMELEDENGAMLYPIWIEYYSLYSWVPSYSESSSKKWNYQLNIDLVPSYI